MANLPQLPVTSDKELTPFLNDGINKCEFVDGRVVDGPPNEPIPAVVFDVRVIESNNPMNAVNSVHTIRVKCRGFSWGKTAQEVVSAFGLLPKAALNAETIEAILKAGKLKGRKAMVQQTTETAKSGATFRTYKCAPLETVPAI